MIYLFIKNKNINMVFISTSDVLFGILGGILLGITTSLHLSLKGWMTGMSGIFYSLITLDQ